MVRMQRHRETMTSMNHVRQISVTTLRGTALRADVQKRWLEATPRTRFTIQMSVFIAAVLAAYNYTLITLLQNVGLETPLAYVSLVPVISLFLAAVKRVPRRPEPPIHDRQLDYLVGIPLIGAALAINLVLPHKLSVIFWTQRYDLLSMPLFVAGLIAVIFGTRILWRQKLAVAFLFLAWPVPYNTVLLGVLNWFTSITIVSLHRLVGIVHVATPIPGSDSSLFSVVHHGVSFPLSVVSACSGVNSVVGFLLVGASFGGVVRGPLIRKTLWLAGGMLVIWGMNIFRLMFIFWAGKEWGEHIAISILHPFVGLLTFSIGVVIMIVMIRPLGMTIGTIGALSASANPATTSIQDQRQVPRAGVTAARRTALAVPKVPAAITVAVISAVFFGVLNTHLRIYNLVANSAGEPTLTSFNAESQAAPAGFSRDYVTDYTWATPYFGDNSSWNRYEYLADGLREQKSNLGSNEPVFEDVIDTTDLNSFSAYGIEACYTFHGYTLVDVADVNLGGGITGQSLAYQTQTNGNWSIVYWIVPVTVNKATHFERIVLYIQDSTSSEVHAPASVSGVQNLSGSLTGGGTSGAVLQKNRNFLVTFARQLIKNQAKAAAAARSTSA